MQEGVALRGPAAILSYRAILVAMVSQNSSVLVFMGYRTIIGRYIAKCHIAQVATWFDRSVRRPI